MADRPIRDLPSVSTPTGQILFPVDQSGEAMKLSLFDINDFCNDESSGSGGVVVTATITGSSGTASIGANTVYEYAKNNTPISLMINRGNNTYVEAKLVKVGKSGNNYTACFYQDIGEVQFSKLWVLDESKNLIVSETLDFWRLDGQDDIYVRQNQHLYLEYEPTDDDDAVNKGYVDALIASGVASDNVVVLTKDENNKVFNGSTAIKGNQINALASANKAVFMWDSDNQRLYQYAEPNGSGAAVFCRPRENGNGVLVETVSATTNDSTFSDSIVLPMVSASDEGKVLGVVNGAWAKMEPVDGLPDMNLNGIEHGVIGDGETDDYSAIQTLLNQIVGSGRNSNGNNSLYLPNRTYLISQPLVIGDNVNFKCDGIISYTGLASALIIDGRYISLDVALISAPNGTAVEITAARNTNHTCYNEIKVNRIASCVRGFYIHDHANQRAVYSCYIWCNQIYGGSNGTYGIEAYTDSFWLTEIHYHIGRVSGFDTGVYLHSDSLYNSEAGLGAHRFYSIQIEGVTNCGYHFVNVENCVIRNARLEESYGGTQMILEGRIVDCDFMFKRIRLDEIDYTKVTYATANYLRANRYNTGGSTHIGFEYLLTNNTLDNTPMIIPIGRTVTVRYDFDTFETVKNLYQSGYGVQVASQHGIATVMLTKFDLAEKIAYFTGLYPTYNQNGGYIMCWTCHEDENGNTVWARAENTMLQTRTERVTSITSSSTDSQYPTAKAVWDLVQSALGNS